ncbi:hypothetical protein C0992_002407 [Termitomyces sp. T32_za158]|nr:hypothetical protein C0992_002407 [Termitomyces sp. T32_za158]
MLHTSTTNKRKAPEDETNANADGLMNTSSMTATSNPLINAAKKAKRESKTGASNKRKLANAEEAPGGLFIVRTQIQPSSSLPMPTAAPAMSKPPAKKFKSFETPQPLSQPLPSKLTKHLPPSRSSLLPASQPATTTRYNTPDADPALDAAVRAMDTEAADLRRLSRAPQTPASSSGSNSKSKFRYSTASASRPTGSGNGQGKCRGTERVIDTSAPLHAEEDETPQIQRNKRLRAGAMAAISSGASEMDTGGELTLNPMTPPRRPGQSASSASGSTRRKSSVGRGKRISSSFEATGIITQPHTSVADTAFYKHIDSDLPDSERIRQLLIWCSARVASTASSDSPLPKLSAAGEAVLRETQEDIVRKLAERRVDLSLFRGPGDSNADSGMNVVLAENKQNVTNRMWEGVYSRDIRRAEEEEEAWKKLSSAYDACARRIRSAIEKRRADLGTPAPSTSSPQFNESNPGAGTGLPSAKAQGKQRAPSLELREQDLLPSSRAGFRLARKVLARSRRRKEASLEETPGAGPSTSAGARTGKGMDPDSRPLPTSSQGYGVDDVDVEMEEGATRKEAEAAEAAEKEFRQRMRDMEFKLDHLFVMVSQTRETTRVVQMTLDARFGVLAQALDARRAGSSGTGGALALTSVAGNTPASVLGRYVGAGLGAGASGRGTKDREEADEALALLRALARVDATRPPAQVGDAARRAVREAQRAGDASERRITEVPVGSGGLGLTPRKMPGTPRRGTTPGR